MRKCQAQWQKANEGARQNEAKMKNYKMQIAKKKEHIVAEILVGCMGFEHIAVFDTVSLNFDTVSFKKEEALALCEV